MSLSLSNVYWTRAPLRSGQDHLSVYLKCLRCMCKPKAEKKIRRTHLELKFKVPRYPSRERHPPICYGHAVTLHTMEEL